MSFLNQLALRYLKGNKSGLKINVLAVVSLLSVALGVFAIVVVQSVMAGFGEDVQKKILRLSYPVQISPQNVEQYSSKELPLSLSQFTQIKALNLFLETELVMRTADNNAQGVKMRALFPEDIPSSLKIEYENATATNFESQDKQVYPGIVVGSELAKSLNIIPQLNEDIELIYPFGEVDPSGEMRPNIRRFRVIGTFKSGYLDYDQKMVLVHFQQGRRLAPVTELPNQWGVVLQNLSETEGVAKQLQNSLSPSFKVETWSQKNQKLFSALKLERRVMFLVLILMVLIAGFNLFTLTHMLSAQRAKELALLKVLGLSQKNIETLFLRIGLGVGGIGALLGLIFAYAFQSYLAYYPLPLPSAYYLDSLPVKIETSFVVMVFVLAILLAIFSAWYPTKKIKYFDESSLLGGQHS